MRSVLALLLVFSASPAYGAVKFDPQTGTGFVDRADVRKAFGWDDAALNARAGDVEFGYRTSTDDVYSVMCGRRTIRVPHQRVSSSTALKVRVERDGFALDGAVAGISGTSVAPAVGFPCPDERKPADKITKVELLCTSTRAALVASHGSSPAESHDLQVTESACHD
ncbi:hypothetical protein AB0M02_10250 [Actinoplanes sp. NPDC051861]|uniref:hypothetical protein n=1 Tax=Actinoplanes sp. NPDC051861 TaxID=3155170 RepID=UPI00343FCC62